MKNKKILIIAISFIAVLNFALIFFLLFNQKKIGFVKTGVIVNEFEGYKTVSKILEKKKKTVQAKIDSLNVLYQNELNSFLNNKTDVKKEQLQRNFNFYSQLKSNYEADVAEEENKLMEGVLNQINSFTAEYAKKNNFDLLFGTTQDGNILHGNEGMDFTDEVLKAINTSYKGN